MPGPGADTQLQMPSPVWLEHGPQGCWPSTNFLPFLASKRWDRRCRPASHPDAGRRSSTPGEGRHLTTENPAGRTPPRVPGPLMQPSLSLTRPPHPHNVPLMPGSHCTPHSNPSLLPREKHMKSGPFLHPHHFQAPAGHLPPELSTVPSRDSASHTELQS